MFVRSLSSKDRIGKTAKSSKRSFDKAAAAKLAEHLTKTATDKELPPVTSSIVTIMAGKDGRLFAAHEDVLAQSPFFQAACKELFFCASAAPRLDLTDEEPATFSAVLEFMYKGDYYPRLLHDRKRNVWYLEDQEEAALLGASQKHDGSTRGSALMHHAGVGDVILRDTAIYCAAERYGLPSLKKLALRKQGFQSGIEVGTILRSMRYAYAHTPDTDSRLRAHYLALIVRSRRTFKRSGTMQLEMARGGSMFFDLFVAMCNHLDDLSCETPKTV